MRTPRRRHSPDLIEQLYKSAKPIDSAGHIYDPERYQENPDGSPKLTKTGVFWLNPGRKHAEDE